MRIIQLPFLLLAFTSLFAQAKVSAVIDKNSITEDSIYRMEFRVQASDNKFYEAGVSCASVNSSFTSDLFVYYSSTHIGATADLGQTCHPAWEVMNRIEQGEKLLISWDEKKFDGVATKLDYRWL